MRRPVLWDYDTRYPKTRWQLKSEDCLIMTVLGGYGNDSPPKQLCGVSLFTPEGSHAAEMIAHELMS